MKSSVAGGAYRMVVGVAPSEKTHLSPVPPTEPRPSREWPGGSLGE